jgi:hypothetical protein
MALTGGIHVRAFSFHVVRILAYCRRPKYKQGSPRVIEVSNTFL